MKALAILLALVATAAADPAVPKKAAPDKFVHAAADAFVAALAADDKGDLATARGLYEKALAIAPHPSTAYNLADVDRRLGDAAAAVVHFEMYLAMLPAAPDRALVQGMIDKLDRAPATVLVGTGAPSDPESVALRDFYVLVDGDVAIKPGTEPEPAPGWDHHAAFAVTTTGDHHDIDLVSSLTWTRLSCKAARGATERCTAHAKPRIDGHLVISTASPIGVFLDLEPQKWTQMYLGAVESGRYDVPPGKRRLRVRDRSYECPAIEVDIPGGANDVLYVHIGSSEYDGLPRCRKLDVKIEKLHFDS